MLHVTVDEQIRISGLNSDQAQAIVQDLTIDNPQFISAVKYSGLQPYQIRNIAKTFKLANYQNGILSVPRGYNFPESVIGKYSLQLLNESTCDYQWNTAPIQIPYPKLLITPTEEQRKALEAFKNDINSKSPKRKFGTYCNVLEVAAGKTILALLQAMETKQQTIILVHTKLIKKVWIKDLCKMFGPGYRENIGIIQGSTAKIGPHFTIAMAQTWFRRKPLWNDWWLHSGCMIFDEMHVCASRTFFECANYAPCRYRIGITGTPKRKDGLEKVIFHCFGQPFYSMQSKGIETENSMPISHIKIIPTKSKLPEKIKRKVKFFKKEIEVETLVDGQRDYHLVLDTISRDQDRDNLITERVVRAYQANKHNSILITTHRVEHAKSLQERIQAALNAPVGILVGESNKTNLEATETALCERKIRVVVATIQMIKVGASIPPLNRLFIATPIGGVLDIEQLCGRIRRKCPDKKNAIIYHFVDFLIPLCKRHFVKHALPYYRDKLQIPNVKNLYMV